MEISRLNWNPCGGRNRRGPRAANEITSRSCSELITLQKWSFLSDKNHRWFLLANRSSTFLNGTRSFFPSRDLNYANTIVFVVRHYTLGKHTNSCFSPNTHLPFIDLRRAVMVTLSEISRVTSLETLCKVLFVANWLKHRTRVIVILKNSYLST